MDICPEQLAGLDVHLAPLTLALAGKSYRSGVDIGPEQFYRLLGESSSMPTTSQPSVGDFVDIYRRLSETDPEILSIHISSGLSGTLNSARAGAELVPEAHVTFVDSKTLSGALGWQVEAALCAARAGWSMADTVALVEAVRQVTDTIYTIATLRYLIHGGRISHLKGLLASVLNIKPIIGVEKAGGTYTQRGQARTLKSSILKLADAIASQYATGSKMRVQVLHGHNAEGAELLRGRLAELFDCTFLPSSYIAPVLGAHTGPGLVGVAFAPAAEYPKLP
jgi:DegV family protein with EDD domain